MKNKSFKYFSAGEIWLWLVSVSIIVVSFLLFDRKSYITMITSLIGATALSFNAKGNPIGQLLMVIFGVIYGLISYSFGYYGEMLTYMGMTVPMALIAFISWIRNPYLGNRAETKVDSLKKGEIWFMIFLTSVVTILFYLILKALNTPNLVPSTLSVATSFAAVYLTFRRNPYFALVYAANDVVLIVLWIMAAMEDISYLSVIFCFFMFLINDIYGFVSWKRMRVRQNRI